MSTIYWRSKVKIVTGEMTQTAALQATREQNETWPQINPLQDKIEQLAALPLDEDGQPPDPQRVLTTDELLTIKELGERFTEAVLVKYATRAIETRDKPDGKWLALQPAESRQLEVTEGEFVTIRFPQDARATMEMLAGLPLTLAHAWAEQAVMDNVEVAKAGFLSWFRIVKPPPTPGALPSAPQASSAPKQKRRTTTTAGEDVIPSAPSESSLSGPEDSTAMG